MADLILFYSVNKQIMAISCFLIKIKTGSYYKIKEEIVIAEREKLRIKNIF